MGSRVANNPINVPSGIELSLVDQQISVKGAKGELAFTVHKLVKVEKADNIIRISPREDSKASLALSGTTRALISNMVTGAHVGFEKKLQLVGVGYRAQAQGNKLNLNLGFSHPVVHDIPVGITVETPSQTEIIVKGADKQLVGQVAADIRRYRPPEVYKGKGIRYVDEVIIRKETKKK